MANVFNWVEIPASNFERALTFYRTILGTEQEFQRTQFGKVHYAFLPMEGEGVSGAIVQGEGYTPSAQGVVVYLVVGGDLNDTLAKVEPAGGKVVMPKTSLGEVSPGFCAMVLDTEGNRIGLYAMD